MSASPSDMPSQLEAPHPEFGYLAPTRRLRRKIALTLNAAVLGGLAGATVVFFTTVDREEKPVTMLARPVLIAPASSTPAAPAPARVATMPAAPAPVVAAPASTTPTSIRPARVDAIAPPVRFIPETMALPAAVPHDLGLRSSVPAAAKVAAKPKKKTVQTPPHEPKPELRAAEARPLRLFGLPIFGFGW